MPDAPRRDAGPRRARHDHPSHAKPNLQQDPLPLLVAPTAPKPPAPRPPVSGNVPRRTQDSQAHARRHAAEGDRLFAQGQFAAAVAHFQQAVAAYPIEPRYHYMLATCAERGGQKQLVEPHLLQAVRLKPDAAVAHQELAQWYAERGRTNEALHHSALALSLAPNEAPYVIVRAIVLHAVGRTDEAWRLIEPLIDAGNAHPALLTLYATIAPKVGHEGKALPVLERALASREVRSTPDGHANVHFLIGQTLDRLGQYDRAFEHFRSGNEIDKTIHAPFDPAAHSRKVSGRIAYFTPQRLRSLPRATHDDRRAVFIVGMPRSGTSLVEQILASHPDVLGAGELDTLFHLPTQVASLTGSSREAYPHQLDHLTIRGADRLASHYLSHLDAVGGRGKSRVTDKLPDNFLRLELVELLFPHARIIHCVRDPLDTCLSCYTSNFNTGNEFSFDLAHLGAYYADYRRLMAHWKNVLTVPILDVRYEDLVLGTEPQARRLLDFLDLPWDAQCLKFYENKRRVNTASEDQVRRPIYTSSIARWKHYEKHLGELMAQLTGSDTSRAAA